MAMTNASSTSRVAGSALCLRRLRWPSARTSGAAVAGCSTASTMVADAACSKRCLRWRDRLSVPEVACGAPGRAAILAASYHRGGEDRRGPRGLEAPAVQVDVEGVQEARDREP